MPHATSPRRVAALALAAFLLVAPTTFAQNPPDLAAKVREKLAADAVGRSFRVDALTTDAKGTTIRGVMLVLGATDEDAKKVAAKVKEKVTAVVREVAGAKEVAFAETAVRGDQLPHLQLQAAANEAGKTNPTADELKLTDARFDVGGKLVVSGIRGRNPKTEEWLNAAVATALAKNPAALGADGKPHVAFSLAPPKEGKEWPLSPAVIQRELVRANNPALARVRVERAYLVATPTTADESHPAGVTWTYMLSGIAVGTTRPDARAITGVCDRVFKDGGWGAMKDSDIGGLTSADRRLPDPAPKIQKAVAAKPNFDGVRFDDRTEFDANGRLMLMGLQPGLDEKQTEALTAVVKEVIESLAVGPDGNALYRKLVERDVSTEKMQPVKLRELHAELRKWTADTYDDVRLSRLSFDDAGLLTLACEAPNDAIKAEVEKQLVAGAAKVVPPAKPVPPNEPPPPFKAAVRFTKLSGGLTRHLQQTVADPKSPKWDAVLIEGGYFNDKNEYTVRGVVNAEKQKQELAEVLDALKNDPRWADYFKPSAKAALELELISMAKLVERARRVMPGYAAFDGMRVTRARYEFDAKDGQTLVFDVQLVGRPTKEAAAKLRDLLAEDAKYYGRRLPKSRAIRFEKDEKAVDANEEFRASSVGFAAAALTKGEAAKAKGWLDTGMLHYPGESALWYLSAYYHHLQGDRELVRRDLYRVIEIEGRADGDGGAQRKRRFAAASGLQGEKRNEVDKVWEECWQEMKDGAKPIKFAEAK